MLGITNVKNNLIISQEEPTPEPEPVITYSDGLAYTLLANDTYSVSGIGTCTDSEINIPPTYNGKDVTEIGDAAFLNLSSITNVTIPNTIITLGASAFRYCGSLTSVTIGTNVTTINSTCFTNSDYIVVTILATTPPTLASVNVFSNIKLIKIIVPQGSLSAYKSATNWNAFALKMEEAS